MNQRAFQVSLLDVRWKREKRIDVESQKSKSEILSRG